VDVHVVGYGGQDVQGRCGTVGTGRAAVKRARAAPPSSRTCPASRPPRRRGNTTSARSVTALTRNSRLTTKARRLEALAQRRGWVGQVVRVDAGDEERRQLAGGGGRPGSRRSTGRAAAAARPTPQARATAARARGVPRPAGRPAGSVGSAPRPRSRPRSPPRAAGFQARLAPVRLGEPDHRRQARRVPRASRSPREYHRAPAAARRAGRVARRWRRARRASSPGDRREQDARHLVQARAGQARRASTPSASACAPPCASRRNTIGRLVLGLEPGQQHRGRLLQLSRS